MPEDMYCSQRLSLFDVAPASWWDVEFSGEATVSGAWGTISAHEDDQLLLLASQQFESSCHSAGTIYESCDRSIL